MSEPVPDAPEVHSLASMPSIPRFDAFQRRHRLLGYPIAVFYKYFDDTGAYLAALLAYYGFISLFPLLLLLSTVLGLVLASDEALRQQILDTAFAQFPVVGDQLGDPRQLSGGGAGLAIGIVGSLYGGIGVAQALQHAMNTAWSVPRNSRPNPFKARARSLALLAIGGVGIAATTGVSIGASTGWTSGVVDRLLLAGGATAVAAVVITVVFRFGTARKLGTREVMPGAIAAAIGWHLLQTFGIVYVDHVVRNASTSNSVFALVLGLVAFLYIGAVILLLGVEINVVRIDRLHPRSLLTPFTDKVVLTPGDERSYTGQAAAQRSKGFQRIHVRFDRMRGVDDDGGVEDDHREDEFP